MREWFFAKPNRVRTLLNLWPPFFFSGIKILSISPDFRRCKVKLKNWPGTRNANGTQFGGSLFAMTDPIYSLMLMGLLGSKYFVWDKSAHIEFQKPGVGEVSVECVISDEMLAAIKENTAGGDKYLPEVVNIITDRQGTVVATVSRVLYVRLKPPFRPRNGEQAG
ncbi:MAG: DUF4442 domain-containing protein [Neisseria sp.]|nr:DUF4442 domain-containing protein [Neisseria sp.]